MLRALYRALERGTDFLVTILGDRPGGGLSSLGMLAGTDNEVAYQGGVRHSPSFGASPEAHYWATSLGVEEVL